MVDTETEEVCLNSELHIVMDQMRQATQRRVMKRRTLTMVIHRGHLLVLSPTWTFPIMTCKQLIDNWYPGNKRENIPPLEVLISLHVAHLVTTGNKNAGKVKLIQMRCMMATLEKYSKKENSYLSDKYLWTNEYTKRMWGKIGEKYIISRFGVQNWNADISWKVMYNNIPK